MRRRNHRALPTSGIEREALREKGQFWTPDWVAEAMVGYAIAEGSNQIFDPAVGAGAFFRAAKTLASESGRQLTLLGTELDPEALNEAQQNGISSDDLQYVQLADFVLNPPKRKFPSIVANPPYIRHHRLNKDIKAALKELAIKMIGVSLDGRAGYHVYFLLRALELLEINGRLAFIMPADTCEGIFSTTLWNWITRHFRLEGVVTFAANASPFPGVDTNPVIFLITNKEPLPEFLWARCNQTETTDLKKWMLSGLEGQPGKTLSVIQRQLPEALSTGLSRAPRDETGDELTLGDVAKVLRGIATGANDFFFLTRDMANRLEIPAEFLLPAIGRTRDVPDNMISIETLSYLDAKGRPTLLFSPDGRPIKEFPQPVRKYVAYGEASGLHRKALISSRNPWYKMETRLIPPILFAYLGRRNSRFILNLAGVLPLTGFLCVYPRDESPTFTRQLWHILNHPDTVKNLSLVGKSYGGNAIKVEPRALEKLPLPREIVLEAGLQIATKPETLPLPLHWT